jgi:hypothetical protein
MELPSVSATIAASAVLVTETGLRDFMAHLDISKLR